MFNKTSPRKNQYVSITKDIYEPQSNTTQTTHHNGSNNNSNSNNNVNNNNTVDKKKKKDFDNIPPYSRLFIVCERDATEEEIESIFKSYGNIEYCRMLKEKKTSDSKGICYIKFDKTSSAAKALEEMNGVVLTANGTPIKIQIAEPKNAKKKIYSKDPEDTPPRSRLFVVCPKVIFITFYFPFFFKNLLHLNYYYYYYYYYYYHYYYFIVIIIMGN